MSELPSDPRSPMEQFRDSLEMGGAQRVNEIPNENPHIPSVEGDRVYMDHPGKEGIVMRALNDGYGVTGYDIGWPHGGLGQGIDPSRIWPVGHLNPSEHYPGRFDRQSAVFHVDQKAQRLMQEGKVTILLNAPNHVMGHVIDEKGSHEVNLYRVDPNSEPAGWDCDCSWSDPSHARMCSHAKAVSWAAKRTPIDEEDEHPGFVHMAMAERSGDPELDSVISEFIKSNPLLDGDDPDYSTPLDHMDEPALAQGFCGQVAEMFLAFIGQRPGMSAQITETNGQDQFGRVYGDEPLDNWYPERSIDTGHQGHAATKITTDTGTYLVDFTASQFGVTDEWSVVQKLDENRGGWQRKFTFKSRTAATVPVLQKAWRLVNNDQVHLHHNTPHYVDGVVKGDHGIYRAYFERTDPSSTRFPQENSHCECDWQQYRWDRTRQWKHLEGQECAHLRALYIKGLQSPLDTEGYEESFKAGPGQRTKPLTDEEQFDKNKGELTEKLPEWLPKEMLPDADVEQQRVFSPDESTPVKSDPVTGEPPMPAVSPQSPQAAPGATTPSAIPGQPFNPFSPPVPTKPGPEHLKLFDITAPEGGQPIPPKNPQSIPGANPPGWENPGNPTQFPGTFSSWKFAEHDGRASDTYDVYDPEFHAEEPDLWEHSELLARWRQLQPALESQRRGLVAQGFPSYEIHLTAPNELGEDVARYMGGTHSRPLIVIDLQKHIDLVPPERLQEAVEDSVRHELQHAIQESEGRDLDEDEAEFGWDDRFSSLGWREASSVCKHCGEPAQFLLDFGDEQGPIPVCAKHEIYEAGIRKEQMGTRPSYQRQRTSTIQFTTVKRSDFHYGAEADIEAWYEGCRQSAVKPVIQLTQPVTLEVRGGKIPVPGAQPVGVSADGLPKYRTRDLGWHPDLEVRVNADWQGPNSSGAPEQRDVYTEIRAGRRGVVTDIEPAMKLVHIQIPFDDVGPLHPMLSAGWVSYSDVAPLAAEPDPFRKR